MTNFKIALAGVAGIVCSIGASEASAQTQPYVSLDVTNLADGDVNGIGFDGDFGYGAAFGLDGVGPFRIEAGTQRMEAAFLGGFIEANAWDYSITGLVDLNLGSRSSVFAGAGLDYIDADITLGGITATDATGDGWHWVAGYGHRLNDNVTLEATVRELHADMDVTGFGDVDLTARSIGVGARFAF